MPFSLRISASSGPYGFLDVVERHGAVDVRLGALPGVVSAVRPRLR
jgi:hypothetical protein